MFVEEDRSCNCSKNNYTMNNNYGCDNSDNEGTVLVANMNSDCDCADKRMANCELRREMINKIRALEFAINELALYLDTHPDDQKALCLHKKYCKECKELKDKYQKVFGPLTINYPCNKWRWLEEPWPWERGNF